MFVCLLQGVQEIANSYVHQQQEAKERRDVIAKEEIRDRPAKVISPGQARGDGKTKLTGLYAKADATRMCGVGTRMEADPKC